MYEGDACMWIVWLTRDLRVLIPEPRCKKMKKKKKVTGKHLKNLLLISQIKLCNIYRSPKQQINHRLAQLCLKT